MARAQQLRDASEWPQALLEYERVLANNPGDAPAYRLRVLTLADLGAAKRALELYGAHPDWFEAGEGTRLRADYIARRIVWGDAPAETEATRLAEMNVALAELNALLATVPVDSDVAHRLQNDRFIALNKLGRHDEVISDWREARAQGRTLPAYTGAPIADSLLARRHPEEAAQLLEATLKQEPDNHQAQILLVYAYIESERFKEAYALLAQMRARQPPWLRQPDASQDYPNWERYDTDTVETLADAFGNAMDAAQRRGESLVGVGAMDADLQSNLAAVYSQRGWPTRALQRERIARTLQPAKAGPRTGEIEALMDLDRTSEARPLLAQLLALYPDDIHVRRLDERWRRRQGWQVAAESSSAHSHGLDNVAGNSPFGTADGTQALRVQSPLFADRWRITAQYGERHADFASGPDDQRVRLQYSGVGLMYTQDRLSASVEVARPQEDTVDRNLMVGVSAQWRFSDQLRGRAAIWRNDPDASLQARRFGITADSAMAGLRYTPSESAEIDGGVQQWRYSDGNRRDSISLAASRRLWATPHVLLDAFGGASASRGSRPDAPYFNPSQDHTLELGLRGDQIIWRRYDRHLRHRLALSAVQYSQEGFGAHWYPVARYEQEWQFAAGGQLRYGLSWSRPVYDGHREQRLGFDIGLYWGE